MVRGKRRALARAYHDRVVAEAPGSDQLDPAASWTPARADAAEALAAALTAAGQPAEAVALLRDTVPRLAEGGATTTTTTTTTTTANGRSCVR